MTIVLLVFAAFFILPIIWLLLAPTKTNTQLLLDGPFSFGSFDQLAANWNELFAFGSGVFSTWIGNSAYYSFAALAITLIVSIPAGYALALIEFKGRRLLLVTTLIVMLIPNTALVLPIFLELSAVRLIGNPLAVILPFSFFPFGVYLTYIYFSTAVSRDLLNAARIDGAGELRVFAQVALPLATPVIALVGFFSFVAQLEQLLPPVPRRRWRQDPGAGRVGEPARQRPGLQPDDGEQHRHPVADAGTRDAALGRAHPVDLPVRAALPRRGNDRGRNQGMTARTT